MEERKKQIAFIRLASTEFIQFWGTIVHAAALLAIALARFNALYQMWNGSATLTAALALVLLTGGMNVFSLGLTLWGRQDLGYRLSYVSIALSTVGLIAVLRERAFPLIVTLVIFSAVGIGWLCAPNLRRFYALAALITIALAAAIERLSPPWRVSFPEASVSFTLFISFTAVFILIAAVHVWRTGNSIRNKLVLAFLAVTLIPLGIIAYVSYSTLTASLTQAANEKLQAAAQTTAVTLDRFILTNLEHVRAVAQFPAVVEYLSLPAARRAGSEEERRAIDLISALEREDPVFISSIALLDASGVDVLDTDANDVGLNKSNREYFKNVIQSGLPYVSDVEFRATTKAPSLYFAAPSRDATGKILGVLRIRYYANILQKFIAAATNQAGETSYAVLLDPNHIHLAHGTQRDRIYKSIVPLSVNQVAELQARGLLPPGTPEELAANLNDFENGLNNLERQPYFSSDVDRDGALERAAFSVMTTKPWIISFIQDESVFLAPITRQTANNLLIIGLIALAVGALGVAFSQTLARPLTRLTQTAQAIAEGDVNAQAEVETKDEIGALAQTFNYMTQQLRDFIVNLEARVAARTKDLATVAEIGVVASAVLEIEKLLNIVADLTKERFNLYHSHIYLLDESGENLVLAAGAGEAGRIMVAEKRSIPLSREQSLVARAARERKGVTVNDVTLAPDFLPNPLLPDTRSELAVPIAAGDTLIGVFDIQSDQVGRFTESDVAIHTTLAAQMAISIQNARLYERAQSQAEFETLVNVISQKIQRAATLKETLQTAARELGAALNAPKVTVKISARQGVNEKN